MPKTPRPMTAVPSASALPQRKNSPTPALS